MERKRLTARPQGPHAVAQPRGGQPGICPPPLGLRQALDRECTHQADHGENGNLQ